MSLLLLLSTLYQKRESKLWSGIDIEVGHAQNGGRNEMPNSLICVDASLVVRLVVDTDDDRLPAQWKEWNETGKQIAAPILLYYEVTNALYQYQKRQLLTSEVVEQALAASLSLPIRLFGDPGLHPLALRLANQYSLPATYDAHYLALAEHLGAEFWSADRRLARKVQSQLDWVHLYA